MKQNVDLTSGSPLKQILLFSLPLLMGNVFQQLYNTVDSMIVGNFVGKEALAAVGASGPIINTLISFLMGLSVGTGIIISQSYGARNMERLQKAVNTIITVIILLSVLLGAAGIVLSPALLKFVQTPADVLGPGIVYLRITFGGIIFLMLGNIMSGIFQGIGDSVSSFIFLAISCVINILLDLVFVVFFHWGVAGVAWATLIAQLCSVLFAIFKINRPVSPVHFTPKNFGIDFPVLKNIMRLGLPAGFQNALAQLGNLLISTMLNSYGSSVIAANVAVIKIDSFAIMPAMTLGSALSVYVGQNIGADKQERISIGVHRTIMLSICISAAVSLLLFCFGNVPMSLFTNDASVVQLGVDKIHRMAPFYFALGLSQCFIGTARGHGRTTVPMIIGILAVFAVRVPSAVILSQMIGVNGIHWSHSICWSGEMLMQAAYYFFGGYRQSAHSGKSNA